MRNTGLRGAHHPSGDLEIDSVAGGGRQGDEPPGRGKTTKIDGHPTADYVYDIDAHSVMIMQTTISSKFQVVIPKPLRERLGLQPRQRLTILEKGGILYLVPEHDVRSLRGVARGIEVAGYRDKSDRL